jgi:hypothetical protein
MAMAAAGCGPLVQSSLHIRGVTRQVGNSDGSGHRACSLFAPRQHTRARFAGIVGCRCGNEQLIPVARNLYYHWYFTVFLVFVPR